jgi:hypothetical protein
MPRHYELRFEQPDGLNGAVLLELLDERAVYWVALDLPGDGFVVIRHDDVVLPRGRLLEVRADGLWAELVCEVPGEHWTFGLEAFGLRLDDRAEARTATVGERVPVGFDLEWDDGHVVGEVLVGRGRFDVNGHGAFVAADGVRGSSWTDWLG